MAFPHTQLRSRSWRPWGVLLGLTACGSPFAHDLPVPASEGRAVVHAVVDLSPSPSCDETFDLALYHDAGVELVTWRRDAASTMPEGSCRQLDVTVRYLPARISEREVVAMMRRNSRLLEVRP